MAVTFFNANATSGAASVGARTLLHTGTAGASLLVWIHSNEATTYSAVAAGLNPLTKLTAVSAGTSRLELWVLSSVPTGVLTISAIPAGTQVATWCMAAATYTGGRAVGGSPFGTVVAGTATTATINISVSATTTGIVAFGFGISANTSLTVNNGNTRASATASTNGRLVIGDITGATAVSISATAGAGTPVWGYAAVPIVASSTPATAIAFDNAAVTGTNGAVSSFGLLLTATSNAVLLVFINSSVQTGGQTISAVNVGASQLTLLGFVDYHGNAVRTQVWGLTAPPSGTLTISAVAVDGNTVALNIAAVTYTGHKTSAGGPFGGTGVVSAAASTGSGNLSVSATAGNVVVMGFGNWMFDPVSVSVGTAFTVRQAPLQFPSVLIADTIGGPAITGTAAASSAVDWGSVGINLIQSDGAAARSANAAFTDAPDIFSASANVRITSRLSATDAPDRFSASAQLRITARLSATEAPDTFAATAGNRITARLSASEAPDTFAATAFSRVTARLSATEAPDTFSASANVRITARLSATDAPDTFSASAQVRVTAFLSATDAQDTFRATATVINTANIYGYVSATDAQDKFSASVNVIVTARLDATDAQDIFAATADLIESADAVVATPDRGAGGGYDRASNDFWDAREKYLKWLQPELEEPELIVEPPHSVEVPHTVPSPINPQILIDYVVEREVILSYLPKIDTISTLESYGSRLQQVNRGIVEQRRLAYLAELKADEDYKIKARLDRSAARQATILKAKKEVVKLSALVIADGVARLYRKR